MKGLLFSSAWSFLSFKDYPDPLKKKLNLDLLEKLVCWIRFTNKQKFHGVDKLNSQEFVTAQKFTRQYNLRYPGELLERFTERRIIKDKKDLFTLVFVVTNITQHINLECSADQYLAYCNSVQRFLHKEYDLLTAIIFEASSPEEHTANNNGFKEIMSRAKDAGCLYELLVTIEFVLGHLDKADDIKQKQFLHSIEAPLTNLVSQEKDIVDNIKTYTHLVSLYEHFDTNDLKKALKNRKLVAFLTAFSKLPIKEITDNEAQKIKDFMDIPDKVVRYLNFYMVENVHCRRYKRVTRPGKERLLRKMAIGYLEDSETVPDPVKELIRISEDPWNNFLYIFSHADMSTNIQNFRFVVANIPENNVVRFSDHHKYIMENENYMKLLSEVQLRALLHYFYTQELDSKELTIQNITQIRKIAEKYGINLLEDYNAFKITAEYNAINIHDYKLLNTDTKIIENLMIYVEEKLPMEKRARYLLKFNEEVGVYNLSSAMKWAIKKFNITELKGAIAQDMLKLQEDIFFIFYPHKYHRYIFSLIKDPEQCGIIGISPEQRKEMLFQLIDSGELRHYEEENIRQEFMNEKERWNQEKELIINRVKEADYFFKIQHVLDKHLDKLIQDKQIVENVLRRIKKLSAQESSMNVITTLVSNNLITPEELLELFTPDRVRSVKNAC